MRTTSRAVLVAGLVTTALVLLVTQLGWLQWVERLTEDARFLHARVPPVRLSDEIRLVAIDDAAIDMYGRWPWSREVVAGALLEVAHAGARTVATDVTFTDPQGDKLSHEVSAFDQALAQGIAATPTVLAVQMGQDNLLEGVWQQPGGQDALVRLTAVVSQDVTADPEAIADAAGLDPAQREAFLARSSAFKRYALWRTLAVRRQAGDVPPDLAAFRARVTGADASLGRFAEEGIVSEAFERDRSFGLLARFMPPGGGEGSPLDAPPIAVLAVEAGGVGFVNCIPDRWGQSRHVPPVWRTGYGAVPQFGLAAAMLQRRLPTARMVVDGDAVRMPDGWRLPLVDGQVLVDWPSAMFGRGTARMLREGKGQSDGVIPIGVLVGLVEERAVLAGLEQRYAELLRDVAAHQELDPAALEMIPVAEPVRQAIREQGEFLFDDLSRPASEVMEGLEEEERALAALYLEWWQTDRNIRQGRELIARAEARLRAELEGKLVFVGYMATGVEADMINTVYGPRTPGVYFHAAVADMALTHRAVTRAPDWIALLLTLSLGLGASLMVARYGSLTSTLLVTLVLIGYVAAAGVWIFNAAHQLMPLVAPVAAGGMAQVAGLGMAAVVNQRERARITRQFRARVSSQLVDQLARNPDALSVRGQQRLACIVFGDLAGFTTISEKLGSEAVVATLNLYMGALTRVLSEERAYVNKFLGDGILAFWSAFGEEPEQCTYAMRACVECQRQVRQIGERPDRAGLPPVSLRLGLATGVVTIGDCGAPPELNDYTVIGDAANLAARLESANKQFGTAVLLDGNTRAGVKDTTGLNLLRLGRVVVVGQSVPVELFTLLVDSPPAGWIEMVTAAVSAFEKGDMATCQAIFDEMETRFGRTKLSEPYRQAMADPEDPRDGILRLRAK